MFLIAVNIPQQDGTFKKIHFKTKTYSVEKGRFLFIDEERCFARDFPESWCSAEEVKE